jgi:hypothetical protein
MRIFNHQLEAKEGRRSCMLAYPSIAAGGVSLDVSVVAQYPRRPLRPPPSAAPPCHRHARLPPHGALFPSVLLVAASRELNCITTC